MRMRQVAFHAPDSAKLDRLAEIVEESGEDGFKSRLGESVVGSVTGSVPPAARHPW